MIDHITIMYGGWYGPPSDCDEAMPYEIELDERQAAMVEKALRNGEPADSIPEIAELIDQAIDELREEKIDMLRSNEDSYTMECLGYKWSNGEWVFAHDDDPDFEPSDPFDGGYQFIVDIDEDELLEQLEDEDEEDNEDEAAW